jgi:hypothetical protein
LPLVKCLFIALNMRIMLRAGCSTAQPGASPGASMLDC